MASHSLYKMANLFCLFGSFTCHHFRTQCSSKRSHASKLLNTNIYKSENTYKINNNIMIIGDERKKNVDVFSSILNTITGSLML